MSKKKHRIQLPTSEEVERFAGAAPRSDGSENAPDGGPSPEEASPPSPPAQDAAPSDDVESLRREIEEYKDKLLRAKAETQNLLRRTAIEKSEAIRYANEALAKALLPVVDDFERTLQAGGESGNAEAVMEGVRLVYDKLAKVFRDHQVTPIEALGKAFDPVYHSAAARQPSDEHEPGTVTRELQKGYCLRDRVIRPAQVIIAAAPADAEGDSPPQ
ncbi:MAG: nucleotide exchange factor GrpE [Phycisphaerales bacterium]|nr:MAG: nucleotide exchange factor GrpE [Phycisphaerales bacterium]